MVKKQFETFKEYSQRWRELAAQVKPPLQDKEMILMFIDTLQSPFYEHMLGSFSFNFSDIVIIGERVEFGLKSGKIAHGLFTVANPKIPDLEGKEGEVQVTYNIPHYDSHALPVPENSYQQNSRTMMKSKKNESLNSTPIRFQSEEENCSIHSHSNDLHRALATTSQWGTSCDLPSESVKNTKP